MNSNQQHQTIYSPYCYLIGWTKLNKFYYGVRHSTGTNCLYESGCHPDDLWVKYFTSSHYVREYRSKYGEPDVIQVRRTFETAERAIVWEQKVLTKILRGSSREKFLNKNINGSFVIDDTLRSRISESLKGITRSEETKRRISEGMKGIGKGRKLSDETKSKMSASRTGVSHSIERKQKISEAMKGKKKRKRSVSLVT